jgi:4-diphosphocytidyl-2-C-methyl-D-erythritol kinase
MLTYTLIAPAKINLYLEIIGDRPDGFHELAMIMQSVTLADRLALRPNALQTFRLYCSHPQVPQDESNLALQAAHLMAREFPETYANLGGVDIELEKNIPIAAGLAGGSGNAAAVLVGIDLIWKLGLTQSELQNLGAKLGSDVPFSLVGGTAIATGRGEKIDPLPGYDQLWVVLAKYESLAVSTPWAYQTYRQTYGHTYAPTYARDRPALVAQAHQVHAGGLVSALNHQDPQQVGQLLHNDLEKVVLKAYDQVNHLRQQMQQAGGLGTMMSGSGPTVFTLCESLSEAKQLAQQVQTTLDNPDLKLWVTQFNRRGIQIA